MNPIYMPMPGSDEIVDEITADPSNARGRLTVHRFPDLESLVRIETDPGGGPVALVCAMRDPDRWLAPLIFAGDTLREMGASRVILVAPYLGYMRQDQRFHPGEAVSARSFARVLSAVFDGLVTVDPHLHRIKDLSEVFSIPTRVVGSAPAIAEWIRSNVESPLIVGPDSESRQWVAKVADLIGAPYTVASKLRAGDREVHETASIEGADRSRTPVIVDDIISSGRTMLEAARLIGERGLPAPVCIGVHAVFAGDALEQMRRARFAKIITCNTIRHETNGISVAGPLAGATQSVVQEALAAH